MSFSKGTYATQQQIYSLSFIANAAFGLSMPSLEDLQGYVTAVTTQVIGSTATKYNPTAYIGTDWVSVWGTIVYSNSPNNEVVVVDNAMGLFYSPSQNLFVIAIAGTNGNSSYDWFSENFKMNTTVAWQDIIGQGGATVPSPYQDAAIATGFATGLDILANKMVDANGKTMLQALNAYLVTNKTQDATLAITGHSLGGALCPVLALYIYQMQQNSTLNWNTTNGVTTISAFPTAGPTAGESNFAAYYASVVSASEGTFTYLSQYNPLDVVPQAWMLSSMETVPGIYDSNLMNDPGCAAAPFMGPLVLGMMAETVLKTYDSLKIPHYNPIAYTQIEPRTAMSGSSFDTLLNSGVIAVVQNDYIGNFSGSTLAQYSGQITSVACFLKQMLYQHTTAYTGSSFLFPGLLNIGGFIADYGKIKTALLDGTTDEDLQNQAFSKLLARYVPGITPADLAEAGKTKA
jgi:hypothetical protein